MFKPILVLITRVSDDWHNPSLELREFPFLIDAINYCFKLHPEIIIKDQKQREDYQLYHDDIEDRGIEFKKYDYHIMLYDGYIE
jgi:hypothetical protein